MQVEKTGGKGAGVPGIGISPTKHRGGTASDFDSKYEVVQYAWSLGGAGEVIVGSGMDSDFTAQAMGSLWKEGLRVYLF